MANPRIRIRDALVPQLAGSMALSRFQRKLSQAVLGKVCPDAPETRIPVESRGSDRPVSAAGVEQPPVAKVKGQETRRVRLAGDLERERFCRGVHGATQHLP